MVMVGGNIERLEGSKWIKKEFWNGNLDRVKKKPRGKGGLKG